MLLTNLRKNTKKLLWATIILIIPSFIAWNIGTRGKGARDIAATVNRRNITTSEYAAVLNRYYAYYQDIYKDEFTEEVATKLKLREKALNGLIEDILLAGEAGRRHIKIVTPHAIQKKIRENVFFKNDKGEFDEEKYNFFLTAWRQSTWDYLRDWARREILKEEISRQIRESFKITDEELYDEFIKEFELVKVAYVSFTPAQYISQIKPIEEELKAFYEEHKKEFEKPESVNIEYLAIRPEELKKEIAISDEDVKKYYEDNPDEFYKPEEIRCRHILMRAPPDASPEKINAILKQFDFMMGKYKEDVTFETLARVYSEDYNTKANGGDLGYFRRGTMPPEFEDAAFKLNIGEVSKVVKTGGGYHLIKLEDRRSPHDETLEEASPEIKEKLLNERAAAMAKEKAEKLYDEVYDVETLRDASKNITSLLKSLDFLVWEKR